MLIVAVRTFILYVIVLFAVRLMGKAELSKMSPFQLVIVFMIAELAAIPIDSPSASLINGVMAIFTLMFLEISFSFISIKSEKFKRLVSGTPSILIEKGRLNLSELKKLRITNTDLIEQLRLANCPSISSVQFAIMESNGQLSIIPKAKDKPLTPQDLCLATTESALPMILISDGTLYRKNLFKAGLAEDDFTTKLALSGIDSFEKVFMAFLDEKGNIHVYLKSEKSNPFAMEVKI